MPGVQVHSKNFDLLKIRAKSLKIRAQMFRHLCSIYWSMRLT